MVLGKFSGVSINSCVFQITHLPKCWRERKLFFSSQTYKENFWYLINLENFSLGCKDQNNVVGPLCDTHIHSNEPKMRQFNAPLCNCCLHHVRANGHERIFSFDVCLYCLLFVCMHIAIVCVYFNDCLCSFTLVFQMWTDLNNIGVSQHLSVAPKKYRA